MSLPILTLAPIQREHALLIGRWRRAVPHTLRTPLLLMDAQQLAWWEGLQDRRSVDRYWMLEAGRLLVGYGGLTGIQWENGWAEIALLVAPEERGKGYGEAGVAAILAHGFGALRLATIWAEVYQCNPEGLTFWRRMAAAYPSSGPHGLPRRKWWEGRLWDAEGWAFLPGS